MEYSPVLFGVRHGTKFLAHTLRELEAVAAPGKKIAIEAHGSNDRSGGLNWRQYWAAVKKFAADNGMNVVYIDSKVLQARYKKVSSAAETWYVSEVLRERHMVRRILKEKPDVILVGRTHALALKQALKIPSERYREPVLPEGPEARLAVHHMPATRRTPVNHWEVTQRDPNALRRLRRRIIREYRMRRFL